jgi:phosphate transport system permease protein
MSRTVKNALFWGASKLALILCAAVLGFLLLSILWQGGRAISFDFVLSPALDFGTSGGIVFQILGSLLLVVTAAIMVLPIAVGTAIYRHCYMPRARDKTRLDTVLYALNAIPSISYGIFGLIFFVNILGTGLSWFVGSLILAMMMLPTLTLASHATMGSLPKSYQENAAALGMSQGEIIRHVILPQSSGGIVTGLMISLARAIGETAPIMFIATAFSGVTLPQSLVEPVASLPTHILALAQQSTNPQALQNAWGASLVLVSFVAAFSALAFFTRQKFSHLGHR